MLSLHFAPAIMAIIVLSTGCSTIERVFERRSGPHSQTSAQEVAVKKPGSPITPVKIRPPRVDPIPGWCDQLRAEIKALGWQLEPCEGMDWKVGGFSVQGRPLVYAEFGNPSAINKNLILSMTHSDEITPLYMAFMTAFWLKENIAPDANTYVVLAPLINPDGFFKKVKTRVNANGVDVNRNFPTGDWERDGLRLWKSRYRSNPRRFPGNRAGSEPETKFQVELIRNVAPQKILSIHAPLNFLDYDGPTNLSLDRFPEDYVAECLKLRNSLKAIHGGFFPGSLGNYAGQEMGIPTLTLELPSATASAAPAYWQRFSDGVRTMIHFEVPEYDTEAGSTARIGRNDAGTENDHQ